MKSSNTVHIDYFTLDTVAQWGYGIASLQRVCVFSDMIPGTFYALLAGFLGATASLSAKLSLGADYLREMCESGFSGWTPTHSPSATCDWVRNLLCCITFPQYKVRESTARVLSKVLVHSAASEVRRLAIQSPACSEHPCIFSPSRTGALRCIRLEPLSLS